MSDEMVLSARLELKDNMTATVGKTEKSLKGMERSASSAGSAVEAMAGRGNSALRSLAGGASSVDQSLSKLSRPHDVIISARDMATPAISSVERQVGGLDKSVLVNVDVDVSGADEVSALSGELDSLSDASVSAAADTEDSTDKIKASGGSIRETFSAGAAAVGGYMMSIGQRIKAGAAAGKEGLATLSNGMNTVKSAGSGLMMMGLGGFGIAEMAGSAINAGHNLYMMATRMHIATGEAAQLSRVTSMAGVDTNTFMRSMMRLDGQAAKPIKVDKYGVPQMSAAQAMMAKYGVSLTDAEGKLKPMNEQLSELAKGYKAASAAGEDEEFIMNTLGARGMALVPVLENLSEYKEIAGGVQGIGLDPQQAEETWREMQKLKLQAGQIGLVMANAFMPLAKDVFSLLNDQFKGAAKFFSDHKDVTSAAAKVATYGLELMAAAKAAQLLFGVLKAGAGLLSTPFKIFSAIAGGGSKAAATMAASAAGAALSRDMVVNARTVVVNGAIGAGGATGPGGKPGKPSPVPAPPKISWKELGIGGAIAAGIGIMDVMSTREQNAALLKEAAYGIDAATENLEDLKANGGSAEDIAAAEQQLLDAKQYQQDVQIGADIRMDESAGGAVGSVIGTGIGGVLMGPLGMAIGGFIGEQIGKSAGDRFHVYASGDEDAVRKAVEPERSEDSYDQAGLGEEPEMQIRLTAPDPQDIAQAVQDTEDGIATQSLMDMEDNAGYGLKILTMSPDDIAAEYAGVQEAVASGNDAISEDCTETAAEVTSTVDATGTEIETSAMDTETSSEGIWGVFAGNFDSNVAQATAESAAESGADITSSYADAESQTEGAWAGTPGWFEASIWGPLKEGAASAARSMAASLAQAAESAQSGGHGIIASGLNWAANQAAWLGGGYAKNTPNEWTGTTSFVPAYATGTDSFVPAYASGGIASFSAANVAHGLAQVNEHGGELIDLPQGSRIYPAATTERIVRREAEKSGIMQVIPQGMADVQNIWKSAKTSVTNLYDMAHNFYQPSTVAGAMDTESIPQIADYAYPKDRDAAPAAGTAAVAMPSEQVNTPAWPSAGSNVSVNTAPANSPAPVSVSVTGNTFVVREEADIDKIAHQIAQMFQQVNNNYGGAMA